MLGSLLPPNLTMGRPEFISKFQLGKESRKFIGSGTPIRVLTQKSHDLNSFVKAIMGTRSFSEIALNKAEWVKAFKTGNYDLMLMGFGLTVRDWDAISTWFETDAHFNFARIRNKTIDKLLKISRREINPQKRIQNYIELIQMNDEHFWYIPLTEVPLTFGLGKSIGPVDFQNRVVLSPFLNLDSLTKKPQSGGPIQCN